MNTVVSMKPAVLDLQGVCAYVALSEATVQKMVREKMFPRPKLLSKQRVGWLVAEVDAWLAVRPNSDLLPPPNTGSRKGKTRALQELQADRQAA